jgi:hypothetical protein
MVDRTGRAMAELDGLAWPARVFADAYGLRVELRASKHSALAALRRIIPPGARATGAGVPDITYSLIVARGGAHAAYENDRQIAAAGSLDELVAALESHLHLAVAIGARTRLFVHAGAVGWEGGGILLPGRSHAGKSALVAALVRAGATYYSDEYAVLDDEGMLHPFARSLGIRDALGASRRVDPASLGAIGDVPLPVRLVIATRHVGGARWQPTPMTPGATVLALLENTVAARLRPGDALRTLARAAAGASGLRGERGDAGEVAARILATRNA